MDIFLIDNMTQTFNFVFATIKLTPSNYSTGSCWPDKNAIYRIIAWWAEVEKPTKCRIS